jgi:succinoglycan biosynthesis protein ExoW
MAGSRCLRQNAFARDSEGRIMTTVAVIIPYFQREPGILRRALRSVAAQALPDDVRLKVVVVDDESPHPLDEELQGFHLPEPFELVTLWRENGGPGAARNTGLDDLDPSEVDFVAFIDSDDVWFEQHIAASLLALNRGADFHFANSIHDDRTSFSYFDYMAERHDLGIDAAPAARMIPGQEAFDEFIVHCIPHTSQVVYRFSSHPDIRFDTSLRRTGEDQLFWIELARRSEFVSYLTAPMGSRGQGVSIYREALAWDSVNAPDRLIDGLIFRHKLVSSYPLDSDQRLLSEREAQETRDHLLFLCIRNLRYRPVSTLGALYRVSREIPSFWLHFPKTFFRVPGHYRRIVA